MVQADAAGVIHLQPVLFDGPMADFADAEGPIFRLLNGFIQYVQVVLHRLFIQRFKADLLFPGRGGGEPVDQILALLLQAKTEGFEEFSFHKFQSFVI